MNYPSPDSIRPHFRQHVGRLPGLFDEIAIDLFAGGGGMSMAWEIATGRCVDEAVNHDRDAIWMHTVNHPNTRHWREDIWAVDPVEVAEGRPVGWLHGSPDCTHFSMARGGKPVRKEIRGLAWVIIKWAAMLQRQGLGPRLITMENVREFLTWGPLVQKKHGRGRWLWECTRPAAKGQKKIRFTIEGPHSDDGSARAWRLMLGNLGYQVDPLMIPDPSRRGETFKIWKLQLEGLGYVVECKVLDAADYGAPTHRKRLFIVARCDGAEIQWPEKTHGLRSKFNGTDSFTQRRHLSDLRRVETECSNNVSERLSPAFGQDQTRFVQPGRRGLRGSNSRRDGRTGKNGVHSSERLKPFRTAAECIDHSTPCPSIFSRKKELAENTLRRIVRGLVKFVINDPNPYIVNVDHGGPDFRGQHLNQPLPTICQDHGFALVVPSFIAGCGGRAGQSLETPIWLPIGAITGKNDRILVAPNLIQFNGEKGGEARGQRLDLPINTLPAENRFGLTTAFLYDRNGERDGQQPRCRSIGLPLGTIDATANRANLAAAYMVRHRFGEVGWPSIRSPMQTICAQGNHFSLITPYLIGVGGAFHAGEPRAIDRPIGVVMPRGTSSIATPFLYKNTIGETAGQRCDTPLHVITQVHNKFQLVAPLAVKFYKSGIVMPITGPLDAITHRDRFGLASCFLTPLWSNHNAVRDTTHSHASDRRSLRLQRLGNFGAIGDRYHESSFETSPDRPGAVRRNSPPFSSISSCVGFGTHHLGTSEAWLGENQEGVGIWRDAFGLDGPTDDPQINAGFWRVHEFLKRFLGPDAPLPIVRRIDENGIEQQYLIYDIGMRMLSPRELLNAQFGPELAKDYILTGTRESQVAKIGNSVPPYLGAAVIRANWNDRQDDGFDRGVAA